MEEVKYTVSDIVRGNLIGEIGSRLVFILPYHHKYINKTEIEGTLHHFDEFNVSITDECIKILAKYWPRYMVLGNYIGIGINGTIILLQVDGSECKQVVDATSIFGLNIESKITDIQQDSNILAISHVTLDIASTNIYILSDGKIRLQSTFPGELDRKSNFWQHRPCSDVLSGHFDILVSESDNLVLTGKKIGVRDDVYYDDGRLMRFTHEDSKFFRYYFGRNKAVKVFRQRNAIAISNFETGDEINIDLDADRFQILNRFDACSCYDVRYIRGKTQLAISLYGCKRVEFGISEIDFWITYIVDVTKDDIVDVAE